MSLSNNEHDCKKNSLAAYALTNFGFVHIGICDCRFDITENDTALVEENCRFFK